MLRISAKLAMPAGPQAQLWTPPPRSDANVGAVNTKLQALFCGFWDPIVKSSIFKHSLYRIFRFLSPVREVTSPYSCRCDNPLSNSPLHAEPCSCYLGVGLLQVSSEPDPLTSVRTGLRVGPVRLNLAHQEQPHFVGALVPQHSHSARWARGAPVFLQCQWSLSPWGTSIPRDHGNAPSPGWIPASSPGLQPEKLWQQPALEQLPPSPDTCSLPKLFCTCFPNQWFLLIKVLAFAQSLYYLQQLYFHFLHVDDL